MASTPELPETTAAFAAVHAALEQWERNRASGDGRAMRVLEAGCGATSQLHLPTNIELTGLDISEAQLARNAKLHRRILGDIQTHQFGEDRFDLVVCWNVLEHVEDPKRALEGLLSATAPGGLLIVAVPNLWSVKGLVTRLTPFRVHAWFYKYGMGDRSAGTSDFNQFHTVLHPDSAPPRLRAAAMNAGFIVRFYRVYAGSVQEAFCARSRLARAGFAAVAWLSRAATAGRFDLTQSDAVLIAERPAAPSPTRVLQHAP